MIAQGSCKALWHDGRPSVGCFVSCLWFHRPDPAGLHFLSDPQTRKKRLGASQFIRRPAIDTVFRNGKRVQRWGKKENTIGT